MKTKLTTKFSLVTGLVILITMVTFSLYNINMLERIWLQDTLREVDTLGETIINITHYQMLEDHRQQAYKMINEIAGQEGIEKVRLFNKAGLITFSTQDREVGSTVNRGAEACNGCHCDAEISQVQAEDGVHVELVNRSRFFENEQGDRVLGVTREIVNLPSCSTAACHVHAAEQQVLGILDVQVSLSSMQATLLNYEKSVVAFTIFLLCVLGLSLSLLTQKLVRQPVEDMLEHTGRLSRGDLSARIRSRRSDELGKLSNSFDAMAENLEEAQRQLKNWGQTLETKVVQRTAELEKTQTQLLQSAKLASLGELVAGIAHEINNPLSGILLFSSLAANHKNVDPDLKENLETIKRETQRCSQIVQGLLEFSRSSIPEKTSCSLHQVIDESINLISQQPIAQNVDFVRNYHPELPALPLDRGQIRQVFMNLVMNACQAMPSGGTLTIQSVLEEHDVLVEVGDTGFGIEEEQLKQIFDPFFTTKERDGTGLGLSISYGIIENHGGSIKVRSVLGEGTTFSIRLPLKSQLDERES
ncbi:two-component system, NtrC family, sensor kinase [Malonomonas rubra DSM 5091]|uniref:histidine kinase n=1 Tax=Malonomonas rubra DSM 5091 TaxID=1122189 RepID=A0A1M6J5J0_MALRU|nr:HAMP domain-containing histidine kinase [Malonomonas rubra]SHJ41985.1 two-component system, NtrC family, sensor kinase [Malonomonas rubra DSM 5091]